MARSATAYAIGAFVVGIAIGHPVLSEGPGAATASLPQAAAPSPADTLAAQVPLPADSLESRLATLHQALERLPADDRAVLEELIGAAREMMALGDFEAAAILIAD